MWGICSVELELVRRIHRYSGGKRKRKRKGKGKGKERKEKKKNDDKKREVMRIRRRGKKGIVDGEEHRDSFTT